MSYGSKNIQSVKNPIYHYHYYTPNIKKLKENEKKEENQLQQ
jgi:hypothetical protein